MIANSLINLLIEYCDKKYKSFNCEFANTKCVNSRCLGDCNNCLKQIHFPNEYQSSTMKIDYDCQKIIYFYVCDYIIKYASEMYYLLKTTNLLNKNSLLQILSIGCGDCPDLIALEEYLIKNNVVSVNYMGIDKNDLWQDVHKVIKNYYDKLNNKKFNVNFIYDDFLNFNIDGYKPNIIVIQYLFSYLYLHNLHSKMEQIIDKVSDYVNSLDSHDSILVLINDVNSINAGRDEWIKQFNVKINNEKSIIIKNIYYFQYNRMNVNQEIGSLHISNKVVFEFPNNIDDSCYEPWNECRSIQMLIEIQKGDL